MAQNETTTWIPREDCVLPLPYHDFSEFVLRVELLVQRPTIVDLMKV